MVNLAGGIRGLGVALSTIGTQGIAEQQRVAADQRLLDRETAFARIQQTIRNEDLDTNVGRDVEEIKAQTPHLVAKEEALLDAREPYAEAAEGRAANRDEARDARTEARQDRARQRDVVHRYVNAEGHPVLVYGDGTERTLSGTERAPASDDPNAIVDRYTNDDGYRVLVTRGGQEIVGNERVRQTGNQDDDDAPASIADAVSRGVSEGQRRARRSRQGGTLTPRTGAPIRVTTAAEAAALPSGARFQTPDGRIGTRR